jgi:hypothetical protein
MLFRFWRADPLQASLIARPVLGEVPACIEQAEIPVRAAAHSVRVVIVLPIVFPEAHRAELVVSPRFQRQVPAAWTGVRAIFWPSTHVDVRAAAVVTHRTAARR